MKQEIIEWSRTIGMVVGLFLAIQTVAFASFHIPSESMVPTLAVGDRVVVTKFPYGFSKNSIPFNLGSVLPTTKSRLFQGVPKRGDIVVFKHTRDAKTMIKRVIGLPGERISMIGGRLHINGELIEQSLTREYVFTRRDGQQARVREYLETLPGGYTHDIVEVSNRAPLDNVKEITIPEGSLFMMGDNRDMSADSRETWNLGPVPIVNLMGRAEIISYSLGKCGRTNPDVCNSSRILKHLQ